MRYATATDILIPGIMEHIERTGVHSGDSISVYPAPTISDEVRDMLVEYTKQAGTGTACSRTDQHPVYRNGRGGICHRSKSTFFSRTVPYISKVTGIPIVDLATKVIIGNTIKGMGYTPGLAPSRRLYRNQDAGILLRETAWSRNQPWTGNEVHRRMP